MQFMQVKPDQSSVTLVVFDIFRKVLCDSPVYYLFYLYRTIVIPHPNLRMPNFCLKCPSRGPITQPVVEEYFMGVGRSMLTLIQFVTLDELRSFYYPLILERPWLSV